MGVMPHVLLIEDDHSVRNGIELVLRRHNHHVHAVGTGEEGLALLRSRPAGNQIEIVVLDLMLPGMDGFEVCRRTRALGATPIIMLTARSDDLDIVSGLEAGADDYVVKPITARVLEARIRAVLRRVEPARTDTTELDGLVIDRAALTVTKHGTPIVLPPTELRLLLELSGASGRVLGREQLLELVWQHGFLGDSRLVDACVRRLRTKIEDIPAQPRYIQTVRGFGYRFGRP